jgi:hypothetical protein
MGEVFRVRNPGVPTLQPRVGCRVKAREGRMPMTLVMGIATRRKASKRRKPREVIAIEVLG